VSRKIVGTIALAAVVAVAASAVAQPQVRQTERLVQRAENTVEQIGRLRAQLRDTLGIYNTLMAGSGDSKKIFNDLGKAVDRTEDRRSDVRKRGDDMEKEAHKFFEEWTESLADIASAEMRHRGQERLNATRLTFSEILTAGRRAGADFDVFMGSLRDQITYLGFDLNPSGIASLTEDAVRLNAQAEALFANIDEVTGTMTQYAESLRAQ
jgi:septal ring factor EnvC (AmiA/AmiB activator)